MVLKKYQKQEYLPMLYFERQIHALHFMSSKLNSQISWPNVTYPEFENNQFTMTFLLLVNIGFAK